MVRDVFRFATVLLLCQVSDYNAYFLTGTYTTHPQQDRLASSALQCPTALTKLPSLNESCHVDADCATATNRIGYQCCPIGSHRFCLQVIRSHSPTSATAELARHRPFLGVPRYCPSTDPLHEFLPVQNCTKDKECEPRICCPDGQYSYCRTAIFKLDSRKTPVTKTVLRNLVSFMQCSSPPPPSLDLFPKTCKYAFDCFPNICCQEKSRKVCRPAKRSILRFFASLNY